jgi:hypothetical protein
MREGGTKQQQQQQQQQQQPPNTASYPTFHHALLSVYTIPLLTVIITSQPALQST